MARGGFQEQPHTADLCLAVWGASCAELYRYAALALFEALDCSAAPEHQAATSEIHLHAPDPETLLVDWLGELLYQGERQQACWQTCILHQLSATELQATVQGLRPARPRREVKAVTYAGLEVVEDAQGRWTATLTLDV